MLLSALSTYALRPTKSIFFDKYPVMDSIANCNHAEEQRPTSGSTDTIDSRIVPEGFQDKFDEIYAKHSTGRLDGQ